MNSDNKHAIFKPLSEPITDILKLTLDKCISAISDNSSIFNDIPYINTIKAVYGIHNNIQAVAFLKKYAAFIGPIYDFPNDESAYYERALDELLDNDAERSRLIEQTIISLDRYQTDFKAELLGILYRETFKKRTFTIREYNTLLYSLDRIHPVDGINDLSKFYQYRIEITEADEENSSKIWEKYCNLDYSGLATSGLLLLPTGGAMVGDLGGAYLNDLGFKFYKNIVLKSKRKDQQFF